MLLLLFVELQIQQPQKLEEESVQQNANHNGDEETHHDEKGPISLLEQENHYRQQEDQINEESEDKLLVVPIRQEATVGEYLLLRQVNSQKASDSHVEDQALFEVVLREVVYEMLLVGALEAVLNTGNHVVVRLELGDVETVEEKAQIVESHHEGEQGEDRGLVLKPVFVEDRPNENGVDLVLVFSRGEENQHSNESGGNDIIEGGNASD